MDASDEVLIMKGYITPFKNKLETKDDEEMVAISAAEKNDIRKRYPTVHIARTMKQHSKRHRYYMAEEPGPMQMLRDLRKNAVCSRVRGE